MTVKSAAEVVVPPFVVTWMRPVDAPCGTLNTIFPASAVVGVMVVFPSFRLIKPLKFWPVMITVVPAGPLCGENPIITGGTCVTVVTVKLVVEEVVPLGVVI
jgi:hypothetical protein